MSMKISAMKPPPLIPSSMLQAPAIETPPQPLPRPMQRRPSKESKRPAQMMYPVRAINQNKNPNIGLNLKNGVEITSNTNSIDKLTENLRNISNIISNPCPIQAVPQPMPTVARPEAPKSLEETKESTTVFVEGEMEGRELEKICGEHERVVNLILEEEENIIAAHKQHIDEIVEMVKQEMQLLQELDKPDSDVDVYAALLDTTLANKVEAVNSLRKKLSTFRAHLRQEKELSKKFFEQQNEMEARSAVDVPMAAATSA
eukprot:TRINITY_DN2751_c0_g1_i14.p5 TRINITY_DN2751_c0_g1~~TRINITY_DN2751_c0_g1_i14.p5  ORF type:complete len:259 (-),score=65.83 TRINITY_DN2751_c0_g1_i14:148-924(-)